MKDITKCDCGGYFETVDSRVIAGGIARYRRKKCPYCGKKVHTVETGTDEYMTETEQRLLREGRNDKND